jgi:hypothetical protein
MRDHVIASTGYAASAKAGALIGSSNVKIDPPPLLWTERSPCNSRANL